MLLFQHLIGTSADVVVTPSPTEDEDNNSIEMGCWMAPNGFYDDLHEECDHPPLHNYWGPVADKRNSEWILVTARESITWSDLDLLWMYMPHPNYDAQRHGPDSPESREAVSVANDLVGEFLD